MEADLRGETLVLTLPHTGERLDLTRVRRPSGETVLELVASLPPGQEGPPLHVHHAESERGRVVEGTVGAQVGAEALTLEAGSEAVFPAGTPHRWWNPGTVPVRSEGVVEPLVDFDRYIQAVFHVLSAGPPGRPPLFYMAHVMWRHRKTQTVTAVPAPIRAVGLPLVVAVGRLLGRYRGSEWPGCPARCPGAPEPVLPTNAAAEPGTGASHARTP